MKKYIWVFLLLLLFLLVFLWIVGRDLFFWSSIDDSAFDSFGSFFGGVFGTFFAAIAVYFAWRAYSSDKIRARQDLINYKRTQQREEQNFQDQLLKQDQLLEKEKINFRFYEMLRSHKENVSRIQTVAKGNDIFEKYIIILNSIFNNISNNIQTVYLDGQIFMLSYLYFFFGTNLDEKEFAYQFGIKEEDIKGMNNYFLLNNIVFSGHSLELGIYFRQIYQIVTYIDQQTILTYKEKYNYIKSLRVCLNLSEQYLLYLNSLSTFGRIWEMDEIDFNKKLITKYNLLKNIPKSYMNKFQSFDVEELYPNIYYEYMPFRMKEIREEWEKIYS